MSIVSALTGVGSVLSGIGSVGGLFGGGGGSAKDAYTAQKAAAAGVRYQMMERAKAGKELGISTLAALGMPGFQPASVSVGDGGSSTYDKLGAAGQNITRAASSYMDANARKLQLEGLALDNDLKRAQVAGARATLTGTAPAFSPGAQAVVGQGNSAFETGASPDVGLAVSQSGRFAGVPSEAVKQRIEDMIIPEAQWYLRQIMAPRRPGYTWNPFTSEFVPDSQSYFGRLRAAAERNISRYRRSRFERR